MTAAAKAEASMEAALALTSWPAGLIWASAGGVSLPVKPREEPLLVIMAESDVCSSSGEMRAVHWGEGCWELMKSSNRPSGKE